MIKGNDMGYFSGRLLATLNHDAEVNLMRFSRDGKFLITASGKEDWWGEILVWDVATCQLVKKLPLQRSTIDQFISSEDNKRILTVITGRKTHLRISMWIAVNVSANNIIPMSGSWS